MGTITVLRCLLQRAVYPRLFALTIHLNHLDHSPDPDTSESLGVDADPQLGPR
jgi:hypothetical protein